MLDGLDEIDWGQLSHAYGPAGDVPGLLQDLVSADGQQAREAFSEIVGSLFHQGTVYPATVHAVPFLAEAGSLAPHERAAVIATVGMLADPHHAYGDAYGAVRAAVLAQAAKLVPLLCDPDAEVRASAVYAVAQCGDAAPAGALWQRWASEESPAAQASLVLALGLRDPAASAQLLRSAVVQAANPVRAAAALAILRAGLDWPPGTSVALCEAFAAGADVGYVWQHHGSALDELIRRASETFAVDLLGLLLAEPTPPGRRVAVWALGQRCQASRSAPAQLVPLLGPLLDDPDGGVREEAVGALRRAGVAAGRFADALAEIAEDYPVVAGGRAITAEYLAVQTLDQLGDPRWVDAVCAAWLAGHDVRVFHRGPRFTPAVLDKARSRLTDLVTQTPSASDTVTAVKGLLGFIRTWGPAAAPAGPELQAALTLAPEAAAEAIAATGTSTQPALPHLRSAALAGSVACAVELWRATGDPGPVLTAVEDHLERGGTMLRWELAKAAPAAAALRPLLPRLRGYLTATAHWPYPKREVQIAAARIVWLATAAVDDVLPTVAAVLAGGDTPARTAAELAADLAEPLLETPLRHLLRDRWARVPAARALWRLGVPADELVPALVTAIKNPYGSRGAVAALLEMGAATAVPDLIRLAERDERIITAGTADDIVWDDERLRDELQDAAHRLSIR